jgi:hypothetical protein
MCEVKLGEFRPGAISDPQTTQTRGENSRWE